MKLLEMFDNLRESQNPWPEALWWNSEKGFIPLEDGHHHTEAIEENPSRFGIDPELVRSEENKEDYDYTHNQNMLDAAMRNGWVRIALSYSTKAVSIETTNLQRATFALEAVLDEWPVEDAYIEGHGEHIILQGSRKLQFFIRTGRTPTFEAHEKLLDVPTPSPADIAKQHGVSLAYIKAQLEQGIRIEREHTNHDDVAREIALDHLHERPDYYERLKKVEESTSFVSSVYSSLQKASLSRYIHIQLIMVDRNTAELAQLEMSHGTPTRSGIGTKVMTVVCDLADQMGVRLILKPQALSQYPDEYPQFKNGPDQYDLEAFYQKFGFDFKFGDEEERDQTGMEYSEMMTRDPKGSNSMNESTARTLYHGTARENIPSIKSHGIWPSVGDFTKRAYQESIDAGIDLQDLVFAADKNQIDSCISAIGAWIEHFHPELGVPYTREIFERHGALCVLKHQGDDFRYRDEEDWDEHPEQVEPGDYYTDRTVRVDFILTGKKLVAFLAKYGGRSGKQFAPLPLGESLDVHSLLAQLGGRSDIPNETWLKSKQDYAEEDAEKARKRGRTTGFTANTLSGAVTADITVMLPPALVAELPGLNGEHIPGPEQRGRGVKARQLAPSLKNGYSLSKGGSVFVVVNHHGEAWIAEGNNRTALSLKNRFEEIPVNVRYFNGGELADGPMSPERLVKLNPQIVRESLRVAK